MTRSAQVAFKAWEAAEARVAELAALEAGIDAALDPDAAAEARRDLIDAIVARQHAQEAYARALREEAARTGRPINLTR